MPIDPTATLSYRRARFSTRLPLERRYSAAHCWLAEKEPGVWRVGFTQFALRMLGDLVEIAFVKQPGEAAALGETIGRIEGFKAVADLVAVAGGEFLGGNAALFDDPTLLDLDPYDSGWLYEIRGRPDPAAVDAAGYAAILDGLIDRMISHQEPLPGDDSCRKPGTS